MSTGNGQDCAPANPNLPARLEYRDSQRAAYHGKMTALLYGEDLASEDSDDSLEINLPAALIHVVELDCVQLNSRLGSRTPRPAPVVFDLQLRDEPHGITAADRSPAATSACS